MRTGYRLPTRIHMGAGSLGALAEIAEWHRAKTALLVFDSGLAETVWPNGVRKSLTDAGLSVVPFSDVEPNPRSETVDQGSVLARSESVDLVVGLGGGSVLDAAKGIAMAAPNGGGIAEYEGKNRFTALPLPFVAVPTTCGTGSEVTWVSVITSTEERRKISVKGESMFPSDAVVDHDTLTTLPRALVASTAMDALTHAVEAVIGTASNPVSDVLAEAAIGLIYRYLPRAVTDVEGDPVAREAVMRASTVAGMAFGNADVGGVHCLSETIGGLYDHPHGLVNAMLLAPVMRSHLSAAEDRFIRLARIAERSLEADSREALAPSGKIEGAGEFVESLARLAELVGIPRFASLNLDRPAFSEISEGAVLNGSNASNPRPMVAADYLSILESAAG